MVAAVAGRQGRRVEDRGTGQRQYDWAGFKKNELQPHRKQQWVDAAFTMRAHESEREAVLVRELLHSRSVGAHTVPDDLPAAGPPLDPGDAES